MNYDILVNSSAIPKGTPIGEFNLFKVKCDDYKLSPLRNEIFLLDKFTEGKGRTFFTCVGIAGLRRKAHESGEYTGSPAPTFNGYHLDKFPFGEKLRSCRYTVFRSSREYSYECFWDEYAPVPMNKMWEDKPFVMLAKVTEAMALRKAFEQCNGLYIPEELDKLHNRDAMLENKRVKINNAINKGVDDLIKGL